MQFISFGLYVVLLSLFQFTLAAAENCPNLTGSFNCDFRFPFHVEKKAEITQKEIEGGTVYSILVEGEKISSDLIADGREHKAENAPQIIAKFLRDVIYTATCIDESVRIHGWGYSQLNNQRTEILGLIGNNVTEADLILPMLCKRLQN